jgi:hypothetical protein
MVFYNRLFLAMSKRTVGSITLLQAPYSVLLVLTGTTPGELPLVVQGFVLISCSVRKGLQNNEITVTGDHWPLLVYADCTYDSAEPWEGLFRNKLLVWVILSPFILQNSGN